MGRRALVPAPVPPHRGGRRLSAEPLSYVLPLRWTDDRGAAELAAYLEWLVTRADVVVVDGSPDRLFASHARRWGAAVRHVRPDPSLGYASGKVNGVITGVREASCPAVVIADDDVRYDAAGLERMARLLGEADLVRPQNHFDPLPWHAVWDSGRSLLNRALGEDYPGTLGVRRATFLAMGGYDGDVLFENLELIRSVEAHGGRVLSPPDLHVRRLPPTARHFLSQRVRQAYDSFATPGRMTAELALLPAVLLSRGRRRAALAAALGLGAVALAERGRRRGGLARRVPARASLAAPAWVLERAVCSWLALGARVLVGGVPYAGRIMPRAASPPAALRRRARARAAAAAP